MNNKAKMNLWTGIMVFCLFLISIGLSFVSAAISPSLNLNGQNQFSITNYTSIDAANVSVGSGTNFLDMYSNGTIVIVDSKGYNITFTDGIKWTELIVYPVACPAGSYLTQLADSVICTSITTITNNVTVGTSNNAYFIVGANTTAMSCGSSNYGAIYFDNSTQKHYGCNASGWQGMY
jgi:hypothetical protein